MADKIKVRPGEGRTVRLLTGRKLTTANTPLEGVAVDRSTYINRRIACGDLVVVPDAPAKPAPSPAPVAIAAQSNDTKGA